MTTLTLYQFPTCPYCAKVRAKLDELKLTYKKVIVEHDRDHPKRQELKEKSGVSTVPVLQIDNKYIGESDHIIKELEKISQK